MDRAVMEALVERFQPLIAAEPRVAGRCIHKLVDVVVIAVCGTMAGAGSFVEIAEYGRRKQDFFRRFLELNGGVPCHDTFNRVFRHLRPDAFLQCYMDWIEDFRGSPEGDVIAIDGKTLRGTFDSAAEKSSLHDVSAWSTRCQLTLGRIAVDAKSNEITAIPKLLAQIDIEGAVVTIDAAGCQKAIVADIVECKADYVIGLKGNQEHLHEDVQKAFEEHLQLDDAEKGPGFVKRVSKGHGREEERYCHAIPAPPTLRGFENWAGLATIVMVLTIRYVKGKATTEPRYFISSLPAKARRLLHAVRSHWGIENGLHWVLDVTFDEDRKRIWKDHGPANLANLNRMALSLLKQDRQTQAGIGCKRKMCGWDEEYMLQVLKGDLREPKKKPVI